MVVDGACAGTFCSVPAGGVWPAEPAAPCALSAAPVSGKTPLVEASASEEPAAWLDDAPITGTSITDTLPLSCLPHPAKPAINKNAAIVPIIFRFTRISPFRSCPYRRQGFKKVPTFVEIFFLSSKKFAHPLAWMRKQSHYWTVIGAVNGISYTLCPVSIGLPSAVTVSSDGV